MTPARRTLAAAALLLALVAPPALAQTAPETTKLSFGGADTLSKFVVTVRGTLNGNPQHKALQRAFEAATQAWRGQDAVNIEVRYEDLSRSGPRSRSSPEFLRSTSGQQWVQRATWKTIGSTGLTQGRLDGKITINTNPSVRWHVGDGDPPAGTYDLSTFVLRELYRNLMFSGYLRAGPDANGKKIAYYKDNSPVPSRFDRFLVNEQGCSVLGYLNDKRLQTKLGESGGELLLAALKNGRLFLRGQNPPFSLALHAPESFDGRQSVYFTRERADGRPSLMQARFPPGVRVLEVPPEVLAAQALYTTKTVAAPMCARLSNPYLVGSPRNLRGGTGARRRIGGLPTWAFGLCLVLLLIVLTILTFGLCTLGAVDKHKGRRGAAWWRPACCCTAVEPGKAANDPVFLYIDDATAAKHAASTRSSRDAVAVRSSIEAVRASIELAAIDPRWSADIRQNPPPPPPPPVATEEDAERSRQFSLLSATAATAETQLPARFHK